MNNRHLRIKKLLSSRSSPSDMGTIEAFGSLIATMVKEVTDVPVPESRLGTYLNQNFCDEWPMSDRGEPGPVPTTIRLLDELLELRTAHEESGLEPADDASNAGPNP